MATKTQYYNLDKPSYDEVADIEVINANFDKIDQQMRNNADGVNFAKAISSDAYDNSKLYAVGDYCIHDNKLYRCITAIESAEAFNIAKWEQTTVGKEVNQLNSNLGDLKVGEVAGGKNLIDYSKVIFGYELDTGNLKVNANWYVTDYIKVKPNTTYTLSGTSSTYFNEFTVDKTVIRPNNASTFTTGSTTYYLRFNSIIEGYSTPQLEEGDTATPYEPYIPSVKMLADEVNAQNESLDDYGLNNVFDGKMSQGYWENGSIVRSGGIISSTSKYTPTNTFTVICDDKNAVIHAIACDSNNNSLSDTTGNSKIISVVPSGTSYMIFSISKDNITPENASNISVYIDNEIDVLKNDLKDVKFYVENGDFIIEHQNGDNISRFIMRSNGTIDAQTLYNGTWKETQLLSR